MDKRLSVFIIFLCLLAGCGPQIRNLGIPVDTIVCLGNSITEGHGVSIENTYPYLLEELTGKKVINAGVGGDTTSSAMARLYSDVIRKNPSLVIIELGGNDFLRAVPRLVTIENLIKMIRAIQKGGAVVALCDISFKYQDVDDATLAGYRKATEMISRHTRSILIPRLLEGVMDNPALRQDDIHPNEEGLAIIAQKIYNELRKYLDI